MIEHTQKRPSPIGIPADIQMAIGGDVLSLSEEQTWSYTELFDRYAGSTYGEFHNAQPARFSQYYAYDREAMIRDLGDDVHPLRHMAYTESRILRQLLTWQQLGSGIGYQPFTRQEITAARLGALVHDMGECEHPSLLATCGSLVGDKHVALKTDSDDRQEAVIRKYFYDTLYDDLPREFLDEVEDAIAKPPGSRLREAFATTERVGYFLTGIRAGITALELQPTVAGDEEMHRYTQLSRLGVKVSSSWYEDLQIRGEEFAFARIITSRHQANYEKIKTELASEPANS